MTDEQKNQALQEKPHAEGADWASENVTRPASAPSSRGGTPAKNPEQFRAQMASIFARWGALIDEVCHASSVPPEFLAALVANESGGKETAKRFEQKVYEHLIAVRDGAEPHFGSLKRGDLARFQDAEIRYLASSLGLTQIMGYNVVGYGGNYQRLFEARSNLHVALLLLARFASQFDLDVRKDFEELFRCWNTGQPDGKTFDPRYSESGIERMKIYASLAAGTLPAQAGAAGLDNPLRTEHSANAPAPASRKRG